MAICNLFQPRPSLRDTSERGRDITQAKLELAGQLRNVCCTSGNPSIKLEQREKIEKAKSLARMSHSNVRNLKLLQDAMARMFTIRHSHILFVAGFAAMAFYSNWRRVFLRKSLQRDKRLFFTASFLHPNTFATSTNSHTQILPPCCNTWRLQLTNYDASRKNIPTFSPPNPVHSQRQMSADWPPQDVHLGYPHSHVFYRHDQHMIHWVKVANNNNNNSLHLDSVLICRYLPLVGTSSLRTSKLVLVVTKIPQHAIKPATRSKLGLRLLVSILCSLVLFICC